MASLLVTGGAGFIGANFVRHRVAARPMDAVTVLDALTYAGNRSSLAGLESVGDYVFVHGDIRDRGLVETLLRDRVIDTIVHLAAETHVDTSIDDPAVFVETNVVGTHRLLEAARAVWLDGDDAMTRHRFHHVSTDEVYGSLGRADPAFTETTRYAPNSPYAASKAASDHLVRAYHRTYGLQITISYSSNNYGPYQFPEKLIPLMVVNAVSGKPLPVYGDGSNIRDWLYVQDHVRAIEDLLEHGAVGECYNVGGNEQFANIDVVRIVCRCIDEKFAGAPELRKRFPAAPAARGEKSESLIRFVDDRPGHDWRYAIDAGKIETELGFEPAYRFADGIRVTIDWMLANDDWWRAASDGNHRPRIRAKSRPD
jgi:dTDP-glucose 4,6-dehydratase